MNTEPTVLLDAAFASYPDAPDAPNGYDRSTIQITNLEGLHVEIYQKKDTQDYIVSFRGTETDQPNDIATDLNLGWPQYEKSRDRIQAEIKNLIDKGGLVEITGHSLGGALAQFAAYDLAKEAQQSGRSEILNRVSLTTWNALGGVWGLQRNGGYDPSIVNELRALHFFHSDDIVARFGKGHVGGKMVRLHDPTGQLSNLHDAHMQPELSQALEKGEHFYNDPWYFQIHDSSQMMAAAMIMAFLKRPEEIDGLEILKTILPTLPIQHYITGLDIAQIVGSIIVQQAAIKAQQAWQDPDGFAAEVALIPADISMLLLKDLLLNGLLQGILNATEKSAPQVRAMAGGILERFTNSLLELGHILIAADPNNQASLSELQIWQREQVFADDLQAILGGASLNHCLPGNPSLSAFGDILNALLQQLTPDYRCPLVLDLEGDGLTTLSLSSSGVRFDLNGDGDAEACGWIGATEALLVRDRNGDGRINSGLELFGDHTQLSNGERAEHGFAALADLDSNRDGQIDARDATWDELGLWRDGNSNGSLDAGEWLTLSSHNISSLELNFSAGSGLDTQGNDLRLAGHYRRLDGSRRLLADVWLATAPASTDSQGVLPALSTTDSVSDPTPHSLSSRWLDIGGMGRVVGLQQALQADSSGHLQQLLDQWLQADATQRQTLLAEIAFSWAGITEQPTLIGSPGIDARIPAALHAFSNDRFLAVNWDLNNERTITVLRESFQALCRQIGTLLEAEQLLSPLWSRSIRVDALGLPQLDPNRFELAVQDQLSRSLSDEQLIAAGQALRSHELVRDVLVQGLRARAMDNLVEPDRRLWLLLLPKRQPTASPDGWIWNQVEAELIEASAESNAPILGGGGNDVVLGSDRIDTILSDGGNDLILAGSGDDIISTSIDAGNTTIFAGAGHDSLSLHDGNTSLIYNLGDGYDSLNGNSNRCSNELILGQGISADTIKLIRSDPDLSLEFGAPGSGIRLQNLIIQNHFHENNSPLRTIRFSDGSSWSLQDLKDRLLRGDAADNQITGFSNDDTIWGEGGHDILLGRDGNDQLLGSSGNDTLNGESGSDRLEGGDGHDVLISNLVGGEDTLVGSGGNNLFRHYRGDVLLAANPEDSSTSINTLELPLIWPEDLILERQGNLLKLTYKNVSLAGFSTIRVEDFFRDFTVLNRWNPLQFIQFGSGTRWDAGTLASRFSNAFMGNSSANKLSGRDSDDWLDGMQANDLLQGLAGHDTLQGGSGHDSLVGGAGNDLLLGGDGIDTASWAGLTTAVQVDLSLQGPQDSGAGLDTLLNLENLFGGSGQDRLLGDDLANRLDGGEGDDTLDGGDGNDTLVGGNHLRGDAASYGRAAAAVRVNLALTALQATGGAGSDQLSGIEHLIGSAHNDHLSGSSTANRLEGGDGNDTLVGGAGADSLVGGEGSDLFLYATLAEAGNGSSRDWILDFSAADRIDLNGIDARSDLTGNQAFVWIGSAAFTALGQLRYTRLSNGNGLLEGNCTGSLAADLQLELSGDPDLAGGSPVVL